MIECEAKLWSESPDPEHQAMYGKWRGQPTAPLWDQLTVEAQNYFRAQTRLRLIRRDMWSPFQ